MINVSDTAWVLVGAALIFFMQAGFAMLETGFTRAKNAGNIIMKNLLDFACGSVVFWMIGFGILEGKLDFFITGNYDTNIPTWAYVAFNTMFCATSATIVSGAMAERTKFGAYIIYSVVISALIYPVEAHWAWGSGWLSSLGSSLFGGDTWGFIDYAGGAVVHLTGGIAALVGAKILGPRIGKYNKKGESIAIPGHNITLGALGIFILWFGWFGFNTASSHGLSTIEQAYEVSNTFMTTNIAAASAAVSAMAVTWVRYKKPDVSMTLNGVLAGLVSITAGCAAVEPWAGAIIGALAGVIVVFGIEFVDKVLKIDDPVGAISVHGICGLFGTISVGLFAREGGLFTSGSAQLLLVQVIGAFAIGAWAVCTTWILFEILNKTIGLRVTKEEELMGLDASEHGLSTAYADFISPNRSSEMTGLAFEKKTVSAGVPGTVPPGEAVKVHISPDAVYDAKMTLITIICNQNRFDILKEALNDIGVTGITVYQVLGCGTQKGATEYYRGVPLSLNLLPKVKVEVVVSKVPVKNVLDAAINALYTGHIGDGKIFVYDVENVVKVRTGEEGYDALQGIDED